MLPLFEKYADAYSLLQDLLQDEVPRTLRLFNIRFRLALDIEIGFKGEVSLTKSKPVRDTYVKIIRLMETWNAYEALFHYAKELGKRYIKPKTNKAKAYPMPVLEASGSLLFLGELAAELKALFERDSGFRGDFSQYIGRIEADERIKTTLTQDAQHFLAYLKSQRTSNGTELLSLVYTERNMYYHNGETAKMGMRYSNRKKLLDIYTRCLSTHILHLAIYILQEEAERQQ